MKTKFTFLSLPLSLLCISTFAEVQREVDFTTRAAVQVNGCTTDYVIVGNGTAGALMAEQLSNAVNGKFANGVVVLETGLNRSDDPLVQAGSLGSTNAGPLAADPKYANNTYVFDSIAAQIPVFGTSILYSSGKMWGGSSAHNYLASVRGDPIFWNNMATASGNPRFAYNTLLASMKAIETYTPTGTPFNAAQRGANGPLFVTQAPGYNPADPWQVRFVAALGVTSVPDYNAGVTNVVSVNQQWITPTNPPLRSFSVTAFEPSTVVNFDGSPVGNRKLRILSGAHATRVLFSGTKATGVEFLMNNKLQRVFARKGVIVCAGCPFSAQLLQLSGVGDPTLLNNLGIPVIVANANVGAGLKVHYGPLALVNLEVFSPFEPLSFPDAQPYYTSAAGTRKFELFAFPGIFLLNLQTQAALGIFNPIEAGSTFFAWNLQPKSTGSAFIIDNNPFSFPEMEFNFYSDGDLTDPTSDISASVAALKLIRDIMGGNANMIYPSAAEYADPTDQLLAQVAIRNLTDSALSVTNHYVGTCNFGTVVDSSFNVIGTKNLMVVDNSVYPFPETGNTSESAYMATVVALQTMGVTLQFS